jgi:hypothetical protein
MNRNFNLFLCTAIWAALFSANLWSQSAVLPKDWATVTGQVLDSENRPVPQARISAFPLDVAVEGPVPRGPRTDREGRYKLSIPAYPGRTRLCAIKETAGYPDTQGLLFSSLNDSMPVISLRPSATINDVVIRLGPPDGVLDASVIAGEKGAPVATARISLRRDDPASIYSATVPADGHFTLALPPVPIHVSVDAPGYVRWTYKDPITGNPYLVLPGKSTKTLIVNLVPQSSAAP